MTNEFLTLDILLSEAPAEWEGSPIGRGIVALDCGTAMEHLRGADRVELLVRRDAHPEDAPIVMQATMSALVEDPVQPLVFIRGVRLDDDADISGLYFVGPVGVVHRVISRLEVAKGNH